MQNSVKAQFTLLSLFVLVASFWGCTTDTPQPREEKTSINPKVYRSQSQERNPNLLGASLFDHPGFSGDSLREPPRPKSKKITINEYLCESTNTEDGKKVCMTFFRSGKKIRSDCADSTQQFSIVMSPPAGTDLNGDSVPEVVVEYFSGGAHCCSEYAIFSLGKRLELLDVLNGEHSHFEFKDLNGDGKYEAIGRDWTFAYWNASHAGSPAPEVILHWKNGKYRLAEALMKKSYNREEVMKMTEDFKRNILPVSEDNKSLHADSALWAAMLELIYAGNGNLAWEFFERTWPIPEDKSLTKQWLAEKKIFLAEFKAQLRKSIYWSDLKKMNGW